jgi:hypothetical protein
MPLFRIAARHDAGTFLFDDNPDPDRYEAVPVKRPAKTVEAPASDTEES